MKVETKIFKIYNNDCLKTMKQLEKQGVKIDLVLTDPPYGVTSCKWDFVLPYKVMWERIHNITHKKTPILLFGTNPFLAELIHSNLKEFKYNFIWDKHSISNPFLVKYRPLAVHEEIAVFYKETPYYNPIRIPRRYEHDSTRVSPNDMEFKTSKVNILGGQTITKRRFYVDDGKRYPQTIISQFPSQSGENVNNFRYHPTQKPVNLLEWLIKTYTPKGACVLDFTMGSGSTGVACINTGRKFIGIEKDPKYYRISYQRIKEAIQKKIKEKRGNNETTSRKKEKD